MLSKSIASASYNFVYFFVKIMTAVLWAVFGLFSTAILLFSLTASANPVVPSSEPFVDDNFLKFVQDLNYTTNIQLMDVQGLTKGAAAFEPWSGSYWPIHKGILGIRYSSKTFSRSKSFITNYENYQSNPADFFISTDRIAELSPAEKYDLLIGDTNWTLTQHMWAKGLKDYQKDGGVAGWTGICHGWSAVAHMNPIAPHSPVTVQDVTGRYSITFHANDIKGLMSWLWASSAPSSYRAGDRCRKGIIDRDPYLRPTEPSCLDSNPMSWHLAIVNRVGMNKKSMAMDSSSGPEVWNYPITGYDYNYFDPKTFVPTHSFNAAVRPLSELNNHLFRNVRSPRAVYVVGVIMDAYHPALTEPTAGITSRITTKKETFVYDLELDGAYNIVGGEWYAKETPDFIWTFKDGSEALTREDASLRSKQVSWQPSDGIISEEVAAMAREASKRGDVLATISEALLRASSKTAETPLPPDDGVADEDEIDSD